MMKRKTYWQRCRMAILLALAGAMIGPLLVYANQGMASMHYRIPWSALSAGGGTMTSAAFTMQGAILDGATGFAASEHYRLNAGYWPGWFVWTGRNVNQVSIQLFAETHAYGQWIAGLLVLLCGGMAVWRRRNLVFRRKIRVD